MDTGKPYRRWAQSWLLLTGALALHVVDEAVHDFPSFYNPYAVRISESVPLITLPTFTFRTWIAGLTTAVIILGLLTRYAVRGRAWMGPLSRIFAIVMLVNGLLHIVSSTVLGEIVPGTYSSPLLLAGGYYLLKQIP